MIRRDMEVRRQRDAESILVRRMQAALQRLGYYQGSIDGDFGAGTQAAFAAYRRDRSIPLGSQITEYDIADLEAQARQSNNVPQPAGNDEYEGDEGAGQEPAVEYTAVTPEDTWTDYRFSEFQGALKGPLAPPAGGGWIVVASALSYENVIGAALKYAQDFPSTTIVRSGNGRFAILIGWVSKPEAKQLVALLKAQNIIPTDAFVSSGQKYVGPVWTTASAGLKLRNDVLRYGFFRASAHLWDRVLNASGAAGFSDFTHRVSGVAASDGTISYLTLRKEPGTSAPELTRMPEGTLLKVLERKDGWSRVRLLDGRDGWANAKYLAFNGDVMNGRISQDDLQAPPSDATPYGDRDVQDHLMSEGKTLLDDTQQFLNAHSDQIPNVAAFADAAVRLNTALSQNNYAEIDTATTALRQLLDGNAAFKTFNEETRRARERQEREALERTVKTASQNSYFLKTYVARHLTAPESPTLTGLLKELEAARRAPALDALQDVNRRIDAAVTQYGLDAERKDIDLTYIPEGDGQKPGGPAPADENNPGGAKPESMDSGTKREEAQKIVGEAEALVAQLQRFASTGKQASNPVQTAQLVLNLRASLKARETTAILRDFKALADLLATDPGFTAFADGEKLFKEQEDARKRAAAEKEAKRLIAFTQAFISRNYTSDKLDTMFEVLKQLQDAMKGGQGPDLFRTIDDARVRISQAGLGRELDDFRLDDPGQESAALVQCRSAVEAGDWSEAVRLCEFAIETDKANPKLAELLEAAKQGLEGQEREKQRKQEQAEKLEAARTIATATLDELSAYSAGNGALSDPIAAARLVSALKKVIGGDDATAITAAAEALSAALSQDKGYQAYLESKKQNDGLLDQKLLAEQTTEAKRIRAFIASYVSRNVTAAGVADLLTADDALSKALAAGQASGLREANESARAMIARIGASSELQAFRLPVERPAPVKECIDLVQAKGWNKAESACRAALQGYPGDKELAAATALIDEWREEQRQREENERVAFARKNADEVLARISAFSKTGGSFKDQSGMVDRVANLRRSLAGKDDPELLRSLDAVTAGLDADPGYTGFVKRQEEEEQRNQLEALAEARAESRRIKAFVQGYLEQNIATPDSPALADAVKALDSAAENTSLAAVRAVNGETSELLTKLGLGGKLKEFSLAPKNTAPPAATQNDLVLDHKNRPLLEGDGGDILLLFNNTGTAQGVRRDLVGKLTFSESVPFCWYHGVPAPGTDVRMAYQALEAAGANGIGLTGICAAGDLDTSGIVALRRKDFLATDRNYAKPLVDRFVSGALVPIATVTAQQIRDRIGSDENLSAVISADIKAGTRKGYGVLLGPQDGGELCAAAGAQQEALTSLIEPRLRPLSGELAGWRLVSVKNPDDAFSALRTGKCGGALLDAAGLGQLIAAVEREKLPFKVIPLWFEAAEVIAAQQDIDDKRAAALRTEEERKRAASDAAKQEEIRLQALGETKRQEEAALRGRFGQSAHGLAVRMGDGVKAFTDNPNDAAGRDTAALLPAFSRWYQEQRASGWEVESGGFETSLADYGTVLWQNREVETVFIQTTIRMKHRDLGKYQISCFLLGAVVDGEFNRYRDVFEQPCEAANPALMDWKTARRFTSRWIIE